MMRFCHVTVLLLLLSWSLSARDTITRGEWDKAARHLARKKAGIKEKVPLTRKIYNRMKDRVKQAFIDKLTARIDQEMDISDGAREKLLDTFKVVLNSTSEIDSVTKAMASGKHEDLQESVAKLSGQVLRMASKKMLGDHDKKHDTSLYDTFEKVLDTTDQSKGLVKAWGSSEGGGKLAAIGKQAALAIPFVEKIHSAVKDAAYIEREAFNDLLRDPTVDKVYKNWLQNKDMPVEDVFQQTRSSIFGGSSGALAMLARERGWKPDERAAKVVEMFRKREAIDKKAEAYYKETAADLKEVHKLEMRSTRNSIVLGEVPGSGKKRMDSLAEALDKYRSVKKKMRSDLMRDLGLRSQDLRKLNQYAVLELDRCTKQLTGKFYQNAQSGGRSRRALRAMRKKLLAELRKVIGGGFAVEVEVPEELKAGAKVRFPVTIKGGKAPFTVLRNGKKIGTGSKTSFGVYHRLQNKVGNEILQITVRDSSAPQKVATRKVALPVGPGDLTVRLGGPRTILPGSKVMMEIRITWGEGPYKVVFNNKIIEASTTKTVLRIPYTMEKEKVSGTPLTVSVTDKAGKTATDTYRFQLQIRQSGNFTLIVGGPESARAGSEIDLNISIAGGASPYQMRVNGKPRGSLKYRIGRLKHRLEASRGEQKIYVEVTDAGGGTNSRIHTVQVR